MERRARAERVERGRCAGVTTDADLRVERQSRQLHHQQAQQAVAGWNALHDAVGSYADGHSTL